MFKLFDFTLRFNGYPLKDARDEYRKIQELSEVDFNNYNIEKRKEIVDYHLRYTTSYKVLVGNKNTKIWEELPIMTKKDFQKPLAERLSKNFTTKNVYVNKTSGSSGDPFIFAIGLDGTQEILTLPYKLAFTEFR